ncbi:nucleotidyl transferase AbiEii/AbiGii toxin family protein [Centipeda periodontii]|uniref:nucleotidyl transferase AbiEii/AbiGii toxin family protein n=1 Tax=Centipeda periodontii TaxID=82203 RepID=UPI0012B57241
MVSSKDKPDYVLSTQLLEYAASIIEKAKLPSFTYSLGGGTVLSYVFNHRKSKDIDIFLCVISLPSAGSPPQAVRARSRRAGCRPSGGCGRGGPHP